MTGGSAGQEGYWIGIIQDWKEVCKTRGGGSGELLDRRDAGQEKCWTGEMLDKRDDAGGILDTGQERCWTGEMLGMRDAGQERCWA